MDLKKITDFKNIRELSIATFYYVSSTILGPLLIFGGLGYLADSFFDTSPILLIVGVFVAFLVTNFLLFKKVAKINKAVESYGKKKGDVEDKDKEEEKVFHKQIDKN